MLKVQCFQVIGLKMSTCTPYTVECKREFFADPARHVEVGGGGWCKLTLA